MIALLAGACWLALAGGSRFRGRRACYGSAMIKVLENLVDRMAKLPKAAQDEIVRKVAEVEQRHTGVYQLDDEERADILDALEEVGPRRGRQRRRGCRRVCQADRVRVTYSRRALRQLEEIHAYIDERNPQAAREIIARVGALCEQLGAFPGIGTQSRSSRRARPPGRAVSVQHLLHAHSRAGRGAYPAHPA